MKQQNTIFCTCLFTLFFFVTFTDCTFAASGEYKSYGKAGFGMNSFTCDMDDYGFDEDVTGKVTYGRYLTDNLALEVNIHFFQSDQDDVYNSSTDHRKKWENRLDVGSLTTTVKGEIPMGSLRLYGGAGVGFYSVFLYTDFESNDGTHYYADDDDDNDTVFGAHLLAGLSYDITSRLFIGIEGTYRWTDDIELTGFDSGRRIDIAGNLEGYTASMIFGFRF